MAQKANELDVGTPAASDLFVFSPANGTDPSKAISAANLATAIGGSGGVSSITGTANQVIASASTGAVTLSLPQSIATTSNPTFAGVNLSAALLPTSNDAAAIGSATLMFSDLFLASGAVINFNNSNFTVTHGSNVLTFAGTAGTGISMTSAASASGFILAVTGGGTDEDLYVTPKGAGALVLPFNSGGSILRAGSIESQSFTTNNAWIAENVYYASGFKYRANGGAGLFYFVGPEGQFRFAANGSAGGDAGLGTVVQFKVNSTGNVAMGGTSNATTTADYSNFTLLVTPTKVAVGQGTGTPTYGLHIAPTSGLTAGQTALFQDATASTGITAVIIDSGANQGTTPVVRANGILRATKFNVNGTAGANFSGVIVNLTVVDGIVTAAS